MARTIGILSGKGGVGKTTLVSNLGLAFNKIGKNVLVVDADLSGANLVQHFGIEPITTLNDVLNGRAFITEAFYKIEGIGIIPASILDYEGDATKLTDVLLDVTGDRDLILLDGPSGSGKDAETIVQASDEILIVTEPEMPSITNAIEILKLAEKYNRPITGVVINKYRNERNQLTAKQVQETLDKRLMGRIEDHRNVRDSIALRLPIVVYAPKSKVSKQFMSTAYRILGVENPSKNLRERLRRAFYRPPKEF